MSDESTDKTEEVRERADDSDDIAVDGNDGDGAVLTLDSDTGAPGGEGEGEDGDDAGGDA